MKKNLFLSLLLCYISNTFAQDKKFLDLKRADIAPKIDAVLDDLVWQEADEADGFVEFRPADGTPERENQKTTVKVTYDDNAVYFAAYLRDNPDNIMTQLTSRDNFGQSDFFLISINPNNDAQNDTEFLIFSTGTQGDAVVTSDGNEDWGWNAVWDSSVKIVDDGWIAEIKIPYSALRFSNQEVQTWGIQFHRRHMNDNRQLTWNPIDKTKGRIGQYHGELRGIKNIEPPARLSLNPFTSSVARSFNGETSEDFSIGMDIKYGITENFTLDATLIPDFSQAGFDNVELNLGPFEQEFSEQRQFFKEGIDLFNKGNLFYSRRIGNAPTGNPVLDVNEVLANYPNSVKLLNAVKVSGRTKNGLGIGIFNAITEKAEVLITKTEEVYNPNIGETETILTNRSEVVEPLANYNVLVIDQQFNGNSSVSLINTNVTRSGNFRDANVSGLLFDISNKANKYNVSGEAKMSSLNLENGNQTGFSSRIRLAKVSGKYRYGISHSLADKKYDINDMGILFRNNYSNISLNASYQIFEPTEKLNRFRINFRANYNKLYKPGTYTGKRIGFNLNGQTKKLMSFGGNINWNIGKQYDYFEPRTDGRYFTFKNNFNANAWVGTNRAKIFSISGYNGFATLFDNDRDVFVHWFGLDPRIRFSDKFSLNYSFNYNRGTGGRGYVTNVGDEIIFGQRKQKTIENSISGNYNFNSFHGLSLTFRNYWSTVTYNRDLYSLELDGSTTTNTGYNLDNIGFNPNVNFNTWNLDFRYSWQFAPGSQLTALYRNSLFNFNTASNDSFIGSLNSLFDQPIEHIFSLRLVHYIDYNNIKKVFQKKTS
jgi:Domain of unknown function (DUF5916)/Carbohydrate family 9 binding domain-like